MWRGKDDISRWLNRLRKSEPKTALKLVPMIGAILLSDLRERETDISDPDEEPVLKTLMWLVKFDPNIGQQLFFLFTHALTKERRPLMQIALLRAVTGTAENQV